MTSRVLIVEDEIFVASEIEYIIGDMGYEPVGIASDQRTALAQGEAADLALVDLNLLDGATGLDVGRTLAEHGVTVLFMTANPSQLGSGVPGTLGVLPKPATDREVRQAVEFALAARHAEDARPPARLQLFSSTMAA